MSEREQTSMSSGSRQRDADSTTAVDSAIVDATTHPEPAHPRGVRRVALWAEGALQVLTGAVVVALLLLLLWNIFLRMLNVGGSQVPTEIIELLFTWFVFLGSAVLAYQWDHIEVPLIFVLVRGRRVRLLAHGIVVLACFGLAVLLAVSSVTLLEGSVGRTSPMLHLPQGYWYGSVLAGSVLMAVATGLRLLDYAIRFVQAGEGGEIR